MYIYHTKNENVNDYSNVIRKSQFTSKIITELASYLRYVAHGWVSEKRFIIFPQG
jgi:hypothetical protein